MRKTMSLLLLGLALGTLPACSGGTETPVETDNEPAAFEAKLLDATWPVLVADDELRQPFESHKMWAKLLNSRDYLQAITAGKEVGGMSLARAHADAAIVYRQAALIASHAIVQTYGNMERDYDPAGVAHLVSVGHAILGDLEQARAWSAKVPEDDPTATWHAPWKTWLAGDAVWPPPLEGHPNTLAEVAAGTLPTAPEVPHFKLPERGGKNLPVDAADQTVLLQLAWWHEQAAVAAGLDRAVLDAHIARHRFPAEGPPPETTATLELPMLFGGDHLGPSDASFLSALIASRDLSVIDSWADKSLYARAIQLSKGDDGTIDPDKAGEVASELKRELLKVMADYGGGQRSYHRTFADIAVASTLRAIAEATAIEGDKVKHGKMLIAAFDASRDEAQQPEFLLRFAARDCANSYPMKAATIVHQHTSRYPELAIARFGVDVLGLRVSDEERGTK